MLYVTLHAAWMILAVAAGCVAGYMGLVRATRRPDGKSPFPGRFKMKAHIRFGTVYYVMLYLGILFGWVMHEFLLQGRVMPPGIARVHLILAIPIAVLYGVAWALGWGLVKRAADAGRARPRAHMISNFAACTLVAVQVVLALYYVWISPG